MREYNLGKRVARFLGLTKERRKDISDHVFGEGTVIGKGRKGTGNLLIQTGEAQIKYHNPLLYGILRKGSPVSVAWVEKFDVTEDYEGEDFSKKVEVKRRKTGYELVSVMPSNWVGSRPNYSALTSLDSRRDLL